MQLGRPSIMINGQVEIPMIYALTDVPGGRWTWEELPQYNLQNFCQHGFRLIQVDLSFDHIWLADGKISTQLAQKQLRGILDVCPNAAVFIRLHVNPPKWWDQQHPEEATIYADTFSIPDFDWGLHRFIQIDEINPKRSSLASEKWKKAVGPKLIEFLKAFSKLPEANALAGIQVAGGIYGEWHYWGFINHEPDQSQPMQSYFRDWLRKKYQQPQALQKAWNQHGLTFEQAASPTLTERNTTQAGIFRKPQSERKVIDYLEAQHQLVADDILYFCQIVKQNWPRPIITGAFYGYFYAVFGREAVGGHLELQRVLQSPYIDFLSGPGTYYPQAKEMGDPYRSRSLINSVLLHGKLWLDEMDQQPPLVPYKDTTFATTLKKSIAQTRRNIFAPLAQGMGLWFYDFGPSGFNGGPRLNDHGAFGWWDEPSLMRDVAACKKLFESRWKTPLNRQADVLLVHSNASFYHTGSARKASYMGHWTNNWIPPAIYRTGVIHDAIEVSDLDKVELQRYKCIVFVNTWMLTDTQRSYIQERVAQNGRHLVWMYAPGYSDGDTLNHQFIAQLTGMNIVPAFTSGTSVVKVNTGMVPAHDIKIWSNQVEPLFGVKDDSVESLGHIEGTDLSGLAWKKSPSHHSWYMALPSSEYKLWQYLFKAAGAHLYNEEGDVFYEGNQVLAIHTAKGGPRAIKLRSGIVFMINLPPNSTTFWDAITGAKLM